MIQTDFESLFGAIGKVGDLVTFRAGDSQFPRNGDHLLADLFFIIDEGRDRLRKDRKSPENQEKKKRYAVPF